MDTSKAQDQKRNLIPLVAVESSRITAMGYDRELQTLAISFPAKAGEERGPTYHYFRVPADVSDAFAKAQSKGSYFYNHICAKYDYQRIEPTTGEVKVIQKIETGETQRAA